MSTGYIAEQPPFKLIIAGIECHPSNSGAVIWNRLFGILWDSLLSENSPLGVETLRIDPYF